MFFPCFLPPNKKSLLDFCCLEKKKPLSEPIVSFVSDQPAQNSSRKQPGSSFNTSGCPLAAIGDKQGSTIIYIVYNLQVGTTYKWKIQNLFLIWIGDIDYASVRKITKRVKPQQLTIWLHITLWYFAWLYS